MWYRKKGQHKSRGWGRRNASRFGKAVKSRYVSKGKLSLSKVASDAKYALSIAKTAQGLLNTEKKRVEYNSYGNVVGQVNYNSSGHCVVEITPTPSQGTGYGTRVGSSISLRSIHSRLQLQTQDNFLANGNYKFMIVQTRNGDAFDITKFLNWNRFVYALSSTAIYDTISERDPDYFRDYQVLRTKVIKFPQDTFNNNKQQRTFSLSLNFGRNGKHIRYDDNTNTPTNTRLYIVALADTGNCSGVNASTLGGIMVTGVQTGAFFNMEQTSYFIDN